MGYANAAKNRMLDHLAGNIASGNPIDAVSLHTADPGTTGANEVTGGGYARVAVTSADFDAAAAGSLALNNDKAFSGPAAGACTHVGFWGGGVFQGGGALTGDQAFNSTGEYTVEAGTALDLNA